MSQPKMLNADVQRDQLGCLRHELGSN